MTQETRTEASGLLAMMTEIVSAYVGKNTVSSSDLPSVIQGVYDALKSQGSGAESQNEEKRTPAVPVRKSVHRDYIVCLECGGRQKTLKRHLTAAHGLTPDAYKAKWDLPREYPMVSATYAARRSQMAKQIGLGRLGRGSKALEQPERGRRKRTA